MPRQVTCRSGLRGWQQKLQDNYGSLDEFTDYCAAYAVHTRLGYATPELAWEANPTIRGSVDPDDLEVVTDSDQPREAVLRAIPTAGVRARTGAESARALVKPRADRSPRSPLSVERHQPAGQQVGTMEISGPALGGIESDADHEYLLGTVGELAAGFQCELGQLGFGGLDAVVPGDIVGESWLAAGPQHGRGQPPPVGSQPSPPSEEVNPP